MNFSSLLSWDLLCKCFHQLPWIPLVGKNLDLNFYSVSADVSEIHQILTDLTHPRICSSFLQFWCEKWHSHSPHVLKIDSGHQDTLPIKIAMKTWIHSPLPIWTISHSFILHTTMSVHPICKFHYIPLYDKFLSMKWQSWVLITLNLL